MDKPAGCMVATWTRNARSKKKSLGQPRVCLVCGKETGTGANCLRISQNERKVRTQSNLCVRLPNVLNCALEEFHSNFLCVSCERALNRIETLKEKEQTFIHNFLTNREFFMGKQTDGRLRTVPSEPGPGCRGDLPGPTQAFTETTGRYTEGENCGYKVQLSQYQGYIFDRLHGLWRDQVLCDLVLDTDDGSIEAHKVVMACMSPRMQQSLSTSSDVARCHVRAATVDVRSVLECAYTGRTHLNADNVQGIMNVAESLGFDKLHAVCKVFCQASEHARMRKMELQEDTGRPSGPGGRGATQLDTMAVHKPLKKRLRTLVPLEGDILDSAAKKHCLDTATDSPGRLDPSGYDTQSLYWQVPEESNMEVQSDSVALPGTESPQHRAKETTQEQRAESMLHAGPDAQTTVPNSENITPVTDTSVYMAGTGAGHTSVVTPSRDMFTDNIAESSEYTGGERVSERLDDLNCYSSASPRVKEEVLDSDCEDSLEVSTPKDVQWIVVAPKQEPIDDVEEESLNPPSPILMEPTVCRESYDPGSEDRRGCKQDYNDPPGMELECEGVGDDVVDDVSPIFINYDSESEHSRSKYVEKNTNQRSRRLRPIAPKGSEDLFRQHLQQDAANLDGGHGFPTAIHKHKKHSSALLDLICKPMLKHPSQRNSSEILHHGSTNHTKREYIDNGVEPSEPAEFQATSMIQNLQHSQSLIRKMLNNGPRHQDHPTVAKQVLASCRPANTQQNKISDHLLYHGPGSMWALYYEQMSKHGPKDRDTTQDKDITDRDKDKDSTQKNSLLRQMLHIPREQVSNQGSRVSSIESCIHGRSPNQRQSEDINVLHSTSGSSMLVPSGTASQHSIIRNMLTDRPPHEYPQVKSTEFQEWNNAQRQKEDASVSHDQPEGRGRKVRDLLEGFILQTM